MKAEKTIVCRIMEAKKGKMEALEREYERVQQYVHGDKDIDLYSATKLSLWISYP